MEAGWDLSCLFEQRCRPNSQLPLCSLVKPQSLSVDCGACGERTLDIPLWTVAVLSLGYFRRTMPSLSMVCYSVKTWAQDRFTCVWHSQGIHTSLQHMALSAGFKERASKTASQFAPAEHPSVH